MTDEAGIPIEYSVFPELIKNRYPRAAAPGSIAVFRIYQEWVQVSNAPADPMQVRFGCDYGSHWETIDIPQVGYYDPQSDTFCWHDIPRDTAPRPLDIPASAGTSVPVPGPWQKELAEQWLKEQAAALSPLMNASAVEDQMDSVPPSKQDDL